MTISSNQHARLDKKKKDLLLFVFITLELSVGIVAFSNNLIIVFLAVGPSIISFVSLRKKHVKKNKFRGASTETKKRLPIFLFGAILTPILLGMLFLVYDHDSYEPIGFMSLYFYALIFLTLVFAFMLTIFFIPLAIYNVENRATPAFSGMRYPLLSIIVPAYNEQKNLGGTLESIIEADYANKEIIVVDDGSTDNTYSIAFKHLGSLPLGRSSILRKSNGGKAGAINYGIRYARGEIIAVIDADCRIERLSLKEIVREFQKTGVVAVAGGVKISNRINMLTRCQALEYMISINVHRRAFGSSGITLIVPGPLGAFSKKALLERGLFDNNTSTEDFDVTMKMLKSGGDVPEIIAQSYTRAPTSIRELYIQRDRWYNGAFQTLLKHRGVLTMPRYGILREFLFPIKMLSFLVFPFFDMLVVASTVVAIITGAWIFPFAWISLYLCWQILVSVISIMLDGGRDWRLAIYAPFFVIGYRHFIDFIIIKSIFEVLFHVNGTRFEKKERQPSTMAVKSSPNKSRQ